MGPIRTHCCATREAGQDLAKRKTWQQLEVLALHFLKPELLQCGCRPTHQQALNQQLAMPHVKRAPAVLRCRSSFCCVPCYYCTLFDAQLQPCSAPLLYEVHQAETPNPRSTICYTTQTIQAQVVPAKLCPTIHATQPRACKKTVATAAAHSLLAALLTPQPFRPVHTATDTCAAAPTGGMHAVIAAAAQSLLITVCLLTATTPNTTVLPAAPVRDLVPVRPDQK